MASFSVSKNHFIPSKIGYIDQSIFLNIKYQVSYPTWLMSSDIGGISSAFLLENIKNISKNCNFNYFINSLAKLAMPVGLFCYSEPKLLTNGYVKKLNERQASNYEFFKFVKQHYKWVWVYMLFICHLIYEKKLLFIPLLKSIFYKKKVFKFQATEIKSTKQDTSKNEIDVIIPTIGRKKYLYDVLKDLSKQTVLPKNVIIVEQNPIPDSESELDYLQTESWPFAIKHQFIHQSGACNARNLALGLVESEWVFLNDDDNRFDENLLNLVLIKSQQFGISALTTRYIQKSETLKFPFIHQTGIFGSGNSFVKTAILRDISFNMALEFGYGEDFDFGVQLRNKGCDIIYFPDIKIIHLKAPMGGFRTKIMQQWDDDEVQPKPSPTIMYTFLKHYTPKQLLNYKLVLFLRLIKKESVLNYWRFYTNFKKRWQASQYWAKKIAIKDVNSFML
jgi:glycosyltransferase involved in cell wall biosynthesis